MRYELHCHTYYSRCSLLSPQAILEDCKRKGLDGICITDHNVILGADEVFEANKDKKFKVIKGTEFSTDIGHVIGIFLERHINYHRKRNTVEWLIDQIHEQGGLVIFAHPCSITRSIKRKKFNEKIKNLKFDAIEAYNARNIFGFENNKAKRLALNLNLPMVVGSDAHFESEIGKNIIECNDLYDGIRKGRIKLIYKNPNFNLRSIFNQFSSLTLKIFRKVIGIFFK